MVEHTSELEPQREILIVTGWLDELERTIERTR
jgi:hypothetical protein